MYSTAEKNNKINSDYASGTESELSQQQDVIQPVVQDKTVRRTTCILAVAVIFGIASIWLIIKKSSPAAAIADMSSRQLQIETAIAQLTGIKKEDLTQMNEMVKKFYDFADFQQVRPEQLAKDPFGCSWNSPVIGNHKLPNGRIAEQNAATPDDSLQINSILESERGNCCMVNDALLYTGDKIAGFEVMKIGSNFVKLKSEKKEITLKLQTE